MNAIAGFRLCTLTDEELVRRVDELTDKLYTNGKIPDRQIPARPNDDYDLLVGELLIRFMAKAKPAPPAGKRLIDIATKEGISYVEVDPDTILP